MLCVPSLVATTPLGPISRSAATVGVRPGPSRAAARSRSSCRGRSRSTPRRTSRRRSSLFPTRRPRAAARCRRATSSRRDRCCGRRPGRGRRRRRRTASGRTGRSATLPCGCWRPAIAGRGWTSWRRWSFVMIGAGAVLCDREPGPARRGRVAGVDEERVPGDAARRKAGAADHLPGGARRRWIRRCRRPRAAR